MSLAAAISSSGAPAKGRGHERASAQGSGASGLVPFKTKREAFYDLPPEERNGFDHLGNPALALDMSKEAQALRRVKRLKKSVWASGHLHAMSRPGFRPDKAWFVTLTYDTKGTLGKGSHDWNPNHIKKACEGFRNWCRQRGLPARYTWVAELQKRGTVHYHLVAWLPEGVSMPMWDKPWNTAKLGASRPPLWPYGMTERKECITGVGYLMKYLSKLGELHEFPKGLRLYGIAGLDQSAKKTRSWFNLPQWCKNIAGVGDVCRSGSRLVVAATGEILKSPYITRYVRGFIEIIQTGPIAPRWADGAYSSVSFE